MWRSESKTVEVEDTEEKNEEELNIRLEEKKKNQKGKFFVESPHRLSQGFAHIQVQKVFWEVVSVCVCVT